MSIPLDPHAFQPGTVGILSGDLSRYTSFTQSVLAMAMPPGTQILFVTGMWVAAACNRIIRNMHAESSWLMFLSDDHRFESDMLIRLLGYDVDVIAPLCALRSPPFWPSIFHDTDGIYRNYTWEELAGKTGLLPCPTYGGPGAVIKRHVLDTMGDPWFTCQPGEHPNEDLGFFRRCRQLGFQPYTAMDVLMGHTTSMTLYPQQAADGQWGIRFWTGMDICVLPAYDYMVPEEAFSEAK